MARARSTLLKSRSRAGRTEVTCAVATILAALAVAACGQRADNATSAAGDQALAAESLEAPETSVELPPADIESGTAENEASDTYVERPTPVTYEVPATEDVDAIATNPVNRHTVSIENRSDGTIGWWTTAWAANTPNGVPIICLGSPGGVACATDEPSLTNPIQIRSFSQVPPHGLQMYVRSDITGLTVRSSSGDELPIGVYDPGLPSGTLVASVALGTEPPDQITFIGNDGAEPFMIDYTIPPAARTTAPPAEIRADPYTAPYGPPELEP